MVNIGNDWDDILRDEFIGDNYAKIREFLKKEYFAHTCYPSMYDIFNALKSTDYKNVKVVIIGQDPYHEKGQAHGLSFSVQKGIEIPPSLKNIYKELFDDLGISAPNHGCLQRWADQGVLLLNSVLTVREHIANSHRDCGWQEFTDSVIKKLNEREKPMVFILWGANARSKKQYVDTTRHCVIESAHPSPLSAYNGFFGSKPFSRTNKFLIEAGEDPVEWKIED